MTVRDGAFLGESGHRSRDLGLRVLWQQIAEFDKGADADSSKFSMDSRFEGMCRAHTFLSPKCGEIIMEYRYATITFVRG